MKGLNTVKPVLFAHPLFHEFLDLGDLTKITRCRCIIYHKSISSASKNAKIKGSTMQLILSATSLPLNAVRCQFSSKYALQTLLNDAKV